MTLDKQTPRKLCLQNKRILAQNVWPVKGTGDKKKKKWLNAL